MYFEQILMGRKVYHQDKDGWLNWCEKNKKILADNYIRKVESGETVQDYFGDWNNIKGYSDVGYFLGAEFIWSLSEKYTNTEISNLPPDKIWQEFKRLL